jgi:hypothetical protein
MATREVLPPTTASAPFQAGASLSDPVNLTGSLQAIGVPANWTPAILTFQISPDSGATWFDLMDTNNNEVGYNVTPGTLFTVVTNSPLDNKTWVKFRSGTSRYPVAQPEATALTLIAAA